MSHFPYCTFLHVKTLRAKPVLFGLVLFFLFGQAEHSQLGVGPVGAGGQNVRQQHGQTAVVVQPPDVNRSPFLLQSETANAVEDLWIQLAALRIPAEALTLCISSRRYRHVINVNYT